MAGVNGTVKHMGNTYKYMEVSYGKSRGISVTLQGQGGASYEFKLSPNPHNACKAYNSKQEKFYEEVATDIVQNWPPQVGNTVTALKTDFTLTDR